MTLASFTGCDSGHGMLTVLESDDCDLEFLTYVSDSAMLGMVLTVTLACFIGCDFGLGVL